LIGHLVVGPVPGLEELFRASAAVLGADLDGYRNHARRVFHFARALGAEGPESEHKLGIACHVHDLGIWTDHTFVYLEPSVALATAHLDEQGLSGWAGEISSMIREHHKVTSAGDEGSLVEVFRRADWIDVSPLAPIVLGKMSRTVQVAGVERLRQDQLIGLARRNIETGQRSGEIPETIDAGIAAAAIIGAIRQAASHAFAEAKRPDPQGVTDQLWALISGALGLCTPTSRHE